MPFVIVIDFIIADVIIRKLVGPSVPRCHCHYNIIAIVIVITISIAIASAFVKCTLYRWSIKYFSEMASEENKK